jgi:signal transduction histidine kinase
MPTDGAGAAPATARPPQQIYDLFQESGPELARELAQALRATMFDHRPEVRPTRFGQVAEAEVEAVLDFLRAGSSGPADQRGARLCREGFGEEGVLGLGAALRHFCVARLIDELRVPALALIERYHSAMLRGYTRERKAIILEQQERMRSAIQRTNTRFALQIEVAADIARATTSILDLSELLQTAVDLIRERFELYYVGIFLGDEANRWVTLQASAGEPGQLMLRRGYRLKIGGDSLVGWCVAHGEARIALDVGGTALSFDRPLLEDIHSEMVVPLISRHKVIGAMAMQSRQVSAFSDHDVAVYRITADQLANAIENARLFFDRERRIADLGIAKEAAESASRAKSAFLATMSHELRTPLTAILGYTDLIQRAVEAHDYADVSADLDEVVVAGRHLLSLINDVLDFSKIEAEKMRIAMAGLLINDLLDDVASTVRPLIEQNRNQLSVDCDPEIGVMYSDATRLRQVLVNLLGNAAKFTEGGSVRLSARREAGAGGDWIVFAVADTGIGIANDQIHKLFQPFSQVDNRKERLYGGTGLGLALCRRLCQLLGGTIGVASTYGLGSTFTVRLPAAADRQGAEAAQDAGSSPRPPELPYLGAKLAVPEVAGDTIVLIVAADKAVCARVERQLSAEQLATVAAADAAAGLQLARDVLPDAILLHTAFSERPGGGQELLKALKADPLLATIPVLPFTADDDHGGVEAAPSAFAEQLLSVLRRSLRKAN